jgi:hypothetical protein
MYSESPLALLTDPNSAQHGVNAVATLLEQQGFSKHAAVCSLEGQEMMGLLWDLYESKRAPSPETVEDESAVDPGVLLRGKFMAVDLQTISVCEQKVHIQMLQMSMAAPTAQRENIQANVLRHTQQVVLDLRRKSVLTPRQQIQLTEAQQLIAEMGVTQHPPTAQQ